MQKGMVSQTALHDEGKKGMRADTAAGRAGELQEEQEVQFKPTQAQFLFEIGSQSL